MLKEKLLLIDNYPLFSYGIKVILESKLSTNNITITSKRSEGLTLAKSLKPEVVIVGIDNHASGKIQDKIEYIKLLRQSNKNGKILVITKKEFLKLYFNELIQQNVNGFMTRETDINNLLKILQLITNEQIAFSEELSKNFSFITSAKLTNKEIEILKLIYNEKTNKEISKTLNYSISTVEYYLTNIFTKLSVRSRVGAIREANNMGLL